MSSIRARVRTMCGSNLMFRAPPLRYHPQYLGCVGLRVLVSGTNNHMGIGSWVTTCWDRSGRRDLAREGRSASNRSNEQVNDTAPRRDHSDNFTEVKQVSPDGRDQVALHAIRLDAQQLLYIRGYERERVRLRDLAIELESSLADRRAYSQSVSPRSRQRTGGSMLGTYPGGIKACIPSVPALHNPKTDGDVVS